MSDNFKEKLKQYADGTLPEADYPQMEAELEKLDIYQQYLNEAMGDGEPEQTAKEKKLVKKGKKRSRIANVSNTIGALILLFMIAMGITTFYYSANNFLAKEREALEVAILTTQPNVRTEGVGTGVHGPFRAQQTTNLIRTLGNERIDLGELSATYLFSHLGSISELPRSLRNRNAFISYPVPPEELDSESANWLSSDFDRLEQLHEGTMAELYLTFDSTASMEEVFQRFQGLDVDIRWMAVEVENPTLGDFSWATIGIPGDGYFLSHNWTRTETEAVRQGTWTMSGSVGSHPPIERFGSVAFREQEFIDALAILQENPRIFRSVGLWGVDIDAAIEHIDQNGILIYGVVITGPRNELLELQDESWIQQAQLGEVALINWTSWE